MGSIRTDVASLSARWTQVVAQAVIIGSSVREPTLNSCNLTLTSTT